MAQECWLAVAEDGTETISNIEPIRWDTNFKIAQSLWYPVDIVVLPKGTIVKLIGRELTWLDEPIEYKG